jgi:hypothetical protein
MQHFNQSLRAVALSGVDGDTQLEITAFLDDWVFGFVKRESTAELEMEEVVSEEAWDYLQRQIDSGDYPYIERLVGEGDREEVFQRFVRTYAARERFETGLRMILDGVEGEIKRRGGST